MVDNDSVVDGAFIRRFINALAGDAHGDAHFAVRLAGHDGSDAEVAAVAKDITDRPSVQAVLKNLNLRRMLYTLDDVLEETAKIAFAPFRDFVKVQLNKNGEVVHAVLDPAAKVTCLRLLGEHFGAWGTKRSRTIKNTRDLAERVAAAMQRVHGSPAIPDPALPPPQNKPN